MQEETSSDTPELDDPGYQVIKLIINSWVTNGIDVYKAIELTGLSPARLCHYINRYGDF